MGVHSKDSGTWSSLYPMAKVSGTWERTKLYAKQSGVWRLVYGIPQGLIIMSTDGVIPTGWARYSLSDNKFIVGAGSTYAAKATGGSTSFSNKYQYTSYEGTHSHGGVGVDDTAYGVVSPYYAINGGSSSSDGSHRHKIFASSYVPGKQYTTLMQAQSNLREVPTNGMFFAAEAVSGFSSFSATRYAFAGVGGTSVAPSYTVSCDYGGSHNHGFTTITGVPGGGAGGASSDGSHRHTLTAVVAEDFKKAVLRGLYKAARCGLRTGLIGMWEGSTPPMGWALCDGSNNTVDLRDRFIQFSVSGDGSVSGTDVISFTVGLAADNYGHSHSSNGALSGSGHSYVSYTTENHTHTCPVIAVTPYTPQYYALTFIQYKG